MLFPRGLKLYPPYRFICPNCNPSFGYGYTIDAINRSNISSDLFFALTLFHFSRTLPLAVLINYIFEKDEKDQVAMPSINVGKHTDQIDLFPVMHREIYYSCREYFAALI